MGETWTALRSNPARANSGVHNFGMELASNQSYTVCARHSVKKPQVTEEADNELTEHYCTSRNKVE